jgi:hypothetical protein
LRVGFCGGWGLRHDLGFLTAEVLVAVGWFCSIIACFVTQMDTDEVIAQPDGRLNVERDSVTGRDLVNFGHVGGGE